MEDYRIEISLEDIVFAARAAKKAGLPVHVMAHPGFKGTTYSWPYVERTLLAYNSPQLHGSTELDNWCPHHHRWEVDELAEALQLSKDLSPQEILLKAVELGKQL
jgi:hypothetical protein